MTAERPTPELIRLAAAHGIATEYWSFFGDRVEVPAQTLRAVLDAMHVPAHTDAEVIAALAAAEDGPWRSLLPPSFVSRPGARTLPVYVRDGSAVQVSVRCEDGSWHELPIPDQQPAAREVDGTRFWRVEVPIPASLPLGWHTVRAAERPFGEPDAAPAREASAPLILTPERLPAPPVRPGRTRGWGLMAQLYSVCSTRSWGMGDFADLGDLAALAGDRGADFLLVNPIHAADVVSPIEASPYRPATRRFLAGLYVRPEDIREAAYLTPAERAVVDAARAPVAGADADRIDRDAVWAAKRTALDAVFAVPLTPGRQAELDSFTAREGRPLADFALWCALEEHFDGTERPAEAADIASPLIARLRSELSGRIRFHTWLQWIADQQVQAAQSAAKASGMAIGIMHDLAVGVHPGGSDAWSLRGMYASGMSVGAPPDMYNQQGQNWNQPPWLPAALAESGYAPLREMIRSLLRHAGALRIDHVIGLFRLWWIPAGGSPAEGTYVRYDHEAMIGVLTLEAHRAGAVLIGEDLGLVEPWVRDYLSDRGILGTSVLWFEREGEGFRPPERYRTALLATVNTHDLPPTAGYLADEHVALRARLGLLTRPVEQELAEADAERSAMLAVLRDRGLIGAGATEAQIIEALNVLITASPSQLLGVALVDGVGERRTQNQPGTDKEYPNWQVPLGGPDARPVLLDDLPANPRFTALLTAVDAAL